MTSIGGHQQAALQATRLLSFRLAAGQPIQARVLGPTRHGVSILIGRETFQLHVPSTLANAGTLTLQGTASPSVSGQQVKIIAKDNHPLPKPVEAHLTAGVQKQQLNASTIVQKGQIKVVADPVSPEGRVLGPSVTLHVQTSSPEAATQATVEPSAVVSRDKPVAESNLPHRVPADLARPSGSSAPASHQSIANVGPDRGSKLGGGKSALPDQGGQKSVPMLTLTASGALLPAVAKSSVKAAQSHGDHPGQHQSTATSIFLGDDEATPTKNTTISSALGHRPGAVTEAKSIAPTSHPSELYRAAGSNGAVTASVVGRTSAGNVLLEAAGQLMRIEQPVNLPHGTTLQVTFASGLPAWMTPSDRRASENPATLLDKLIGLLDDIDRVGRQTTDPEKQPLTRQLPAPDRHLASRFLGFLSADVGGKSLPSALSSSPERGGIGIAQGDQIQSLVRELGSMASESLADGWKSLTLPLGSDQSQAVSLYFRGHDLDPDDEASDEEAEQQRAQRAVFDVSFSQLGRCQIDVLCQERRFDLLIRSEKDLGPEDRRDVAELFVSACEIAGMKGEIGFNVGNFFDPVRSCAVATELRT